MPNESQKQQPLDTLAQLRTATENGDNKKTFPKLLKHTDVGDYKRLENRSKRKFLAHDLSLALVKYCDEHPEEGMLKSSYWNTYHCARNVAKKNSKIISNYCKTRWCLVCNSIRQTVLGKKYGPILDEWEDKYFVTLTVPNCSEGSLKEKILHMQKIFTQIKEMFYRRWKRGTGPKFKGLRKLECTYNPYRKDYHPHYHLIVSCKEMAEELVKEWLIRIPSCKPQAQDCRKADGNATKELFKYFTKISTSKDPEKRVAVHALNTIFNAIKGKRTFQPFGFKALTITEEEIEEEETLEIEEDGDNVEEIEVFTWQQELTDWVNQDTGELLKEGLEPPTPGFGDNRPIIQANIPEIPI